MSLTEIFLKLCSMSLTASGVIVVVLIARLVLKPAPKIFSYALWAIVLFRLLCPLTIESPASLLRHQDTIVISQSIPATGQTATDALVSPVNVSPQASSPEGVSVPENNGQRIAGTAAVVWLCGMGGLAVYSGVSLVKLRRKLVGAAPLRENIYLADHIDTPFVLGLVHPKIYLPSSLPEREQKSILLHEQTHIRRRDPLIKAIAFLALALHWFNPLVWVSFHLLGRDMELSCDEAVLKRLGPEIKKDYSASLLSLSTGRRLWLSAPLAFGEGDTTQRIKNVLHYKKPAFWVPATALLLVIAACITLLTDPIPQNTTLSPGEYRPYDILYDISGSFPLADTPAMQFCPGLTTSELGDLLCISITSEYDLSMSANYGKTWTELGRMEPCSLTVAELEGYLIEDSPNSLPLDAISDAYRISASGTFLFAFQTSKGDSYLAGGLENATTGSSGLLWLLQIQPADKVPPVELYS